MVSKILMELKSTLANFILILVFIADQARRKLQKPKVLWNVLLASIMDHSMHRN